MIISSRKMQRKFPRENIFIVAWISGKRKESRFKKPYILVFLLVNIRTKIYAYPVVLINRAGNKHKIEKYAKQKSGTQKISHLNQAERKKQKQKSSKKVTNIL